MNPFIGGLAIGAVGIMVTIAVCNVLMRRMADGYEMRIRARDNRIRILLHEREEAERNANRRRVLEQMREPLR